MAYVYRHIRKDKNIPFYIGIGNDSSYKRAYDKAQRTKYWKNVAKNGYEVEILFDDVDWNFACNKEIEFISLYGRVDNKTGILVNMTNGGEGVLGRVVSQETKEKIRKNKPKNLNPLSEQHKLKISNSLKEFYSNKETTQQRENRIKNRIGKDKGKVISEEQRQKISKKLTGRKMPNEVKIKISESNKGKKVSDKVKAILSAKHTGKKMSDDARAKMSESAKKRIFTDAEKEKIRQKMILIWKNRKHGES